MVSVLATAAEISTLSVCLPQHLIIEVTVDEVKNEKAVSVQRYSIVFFSKKIAVEGEGKYINHEIDSKK